MYPKRSNTRRQNEGRIASQTTNSQNRLTKAKVGRLKIQANTAKRKVEKKVQVSPFMYAQARPSHNQSTTGLRPGGLPLHLPPLAARILYLMIGQPKLRLGATRAQPWRGLLSLTGLLHRTSYPFGHPLRVQFVCGITM